MGSTIGATGPESGCVGVVLVPVGVGGVALALLRNGTVSFMGYHDAGLFTGLGTKEWGWGFFG